MQGGRFESDSMLRPGALVGGMERPPGTAVKYDCPSVPTWEIPIQSGTLLLHHGFHPCRQHMGRELTQKMPDGFWLCSQENTMEKVPLTTTANIRGSSDSTTMRVAKQGEKTPEDVLKFGTGSPCIPPKASQISLLLPQGHSPSKNKSSHISKTETCPGCSDKSKEVTAFLLSTHGRPEHAL